MGYLASGICYDTMGEAAAAQAWASGHDSVQIEGGIAYIVQYFPTGEAESWRLRTVVTRMTDGVELVNSELNYYPPSCGPFSFSQLDSTAGAEIAGAILLVWALGWGFRQLMRLINDTGPVSQIEGS